MIKCIKLNLLSWRQSSYNEKIVAADITESMDSLTIDGVATSIVNVKN